MKQISTGLLCFLCILFFQSCIKNTTPPTQKLAGYEDSAGKFTFVYNGDTIIEAHGVRSDGTFIDTPYIQYTYAPYYVRKTEGLNYYTEYFINSYNLPVLIKPHYPTPIWWNPQYRFYYKGSTSMLDSMIANRDYGYDEYIPTYSGNNITHIQRISHFSIGTDTSAVDSYTYNVIPNIIRSSNSLLYVYNNGAPIGEISLLLVFSANTLDSFSIAPAMVGWGHGKFSYTTNAQNNIVSENYSGGTWPYRREYTYN